MTDIVERLRRDAPQPTDSEDQSFVLFYEAADEIEKLRNELNYAKDTLYSLWSWLKREKEYDG